MYDNKIGAKSKTKKQTLFLSFQNDGLPDFCSFGLIAHFTHFIHIHPSIYRLLIHIVQIQIQFFLTKIYSFQMKWFNLHMNMKLIFKNQNKHNGKQNNHHLFGIKSVEIWNLFIFDSIFRWKTKLKTTTIPMFIWIKFKSF